MISAVISRYFIHPHAVEAPSTGGSLTLQQRTPLQKLCIFLLVAGELAMYAYLISTIPHSFWNEILPQFYEKHKILTKVLGALALAGLLAVVGIIVRRYLHSSVVAPVAAPTVTLQEVLATSKNWEQFLSGREEESFMYWKDKYTGAILLKPPPEYVHPPLNWEHEIDINHPWMELVDSKDKFLYWQNSQNGDWTRDPPADWITPEDIEKARRTGNPIIKRYVAPASTLSSSTTSSTTQSQSPYRIQSSCGDWHCVIDTARSEYFYYNQKTGNSRWDRPSSWNSLKVRLPA